MGSTAPTLPRTNESTPALIRKYFFMAKLLINSLYSNNWLYNNIKEALIVLFSSIENVASFDK